MKKQCTHRSFETEEVARIAKEGIIRSGGNPGNKILKCKKCNKYYFSK